MPLLQVYNSADMMNPADYASSNAMQRRGVSIIMKKFAKELKSMSGICMDVGCGPGDVTNDILLPSLDSNAIVIGTDIDVAMIKYSKKMYNHNTYLEFEVLDIQTKSLPKKFISKLNHIFSFNTLHWCGDIRQAFENMYCMLQSGGTILVLFSASHDTLYEVFKHFCDNSPFAPYLQNIRVLPFYNSAQPSEDLKDLLESVGFNVQHCSLREINFSEINADIFLASILSILCNLLDTMPSERKDEFILEFRREYTNYKNKLYSDNKHYGKKAPDMHKLLIAYAQKGAQ